MSLEDELYNPYAQAVEMDKLTFNWLGTPVIAWPHLQDNIKTIIFSGNFDSNTIARSQYTFSMFIGDVGALFGTL